jgi:hypothetical protein
MALQPLDRNGFLALWRSLVPSSYAAPILEDDANGGVGLDPAAVHAKVWEAFEQAINRSQQAYYLRPHSTQTGPIASGPVKASGAVLVHRAAPALGTLLMPAGTVLLANAIDSFGGTLFLGRYLTTQAFEIPEGVGPFSVPVEAEFPGYTGNIMSGFVTTFEALGRLSVPSKVFSPTQLSRVVPVADNLTASRFSDILIGRYVRLVGGSLTSDNARVSRQVVGTFTDGSGQTGLVIDLGLEEGDVNALTTVEVEEWEDLGISVTQPDPISGGTPDTLGAIGIDRNIGRVPGETDDSFRRRLQLLADIISPASHLRILDRILGSRGIGYRYLETGAIDELMGFTWGVHPWGVGQLALIPKLPGSQLVGQGFVWVDLTKQTRFFLVIVDRSGLGDYGMPYGATVYPLGHPNAWGQGIWGGRPLTFNAIVGQLWAELNAARAAGVGFLILLAD